MIRRRDIRCLLLAALLPALVACGAPPGRAMARVEAAYEAARALKDRIDVLQARGLTRGSNGVRLDEVVAEYETARGRLNAELAALDASAVSTDDRPALEAIRRAAATALVPIVTSPGKGSDSAATGNPDCDYDPDAESRGADGLQQLSERMYACFGHAAAHLVFEGATLDRLSVLGRLPLTDDPARRKQLFLALSPVWTSVNGRNDAQSPYRRLVRLSAARNDAESTSVEAAVASLGMAPERIEEWLTAILEEWRRANPGPAIEPWDFTYRAGRADRALQDVAKLERLRVINHRFYRDLGADPDVLGVRYDIEPREGKDPVAFTTFGARPRLSDGAWAGGEPWVFASYSGGGLGNLNELLHETGHAVHIAAIRARPAFADWPDSDVYTEAIADLAALELFEPEWQAHYLGRSVGLADSLRAKYAGIVMDVAWALFEIRMHRDPDLDPNAVWTEITARHLGIRPHPELSWWAIRGQLVDAPGYMLNYAAGAILIADIRARVKALHGPYATGDPTWYPWVSERLFRYGLERPSRRVVEDFLGRPVSPDAILADMARTAAGSRAGGRQDEAQRGLTPGQTGV